MDTSNLINQRFVLTIITIFITIGVINIVMEKQTDIFDAFTYDCNIKYGVDGWVTVEANDTERPPYYMGDAYVCKQKDNITA